MAIVETRELKKHFQEVRAVDGVDISTKEGEFLVILGPSGSGKSTLMRLIAGLEEPTEGIVVIGGEDVTDLPPRKRDIGMVFQSYALYPHMSVFDNIAFPLRALSNPSKSDIEAKVEWASSILGIEGLLHRRPRQLSGGERQRVALSRALAKEPEVLLLDEPLSNLDAKLRASARDELERFQRRLGITTIFVTHDQVEAMGLGDRIVVMHKGRVRQVGTPEEVYHDSADTFVATFLGSPSMNLIERSGVLVGFRPEQFMPRDMAAEDNDLQSFRFHVGRVEYLGADQLVYGEVLSATGEVDAISRLSSEESIPLEAGETYEFVVEKQRLRFFDKDTGQRTEPVEF